jgi:glutamyl-tRNA synthetase
MEEKVLRKNILKHADLKEWLPVMAERLEALAEFTPDSVEQAIRGLATELDVKAGILINGARTAVTGQAAGAGLFDVLATVGKERVVRRLRQAPSFFEAME